MVNDFIFELGCEELPSGAVWPLAKELTNLVLAALNKAQLNYGEVKTFATPRRLALIINDLQAEQQSQTVMRRGPAVDAAYDHDGKPTSALMGFAKSCGVTVDSLRRLQTEKGDWMVCDLNSAGAKTKELLPSIVSQSLGALPITKPMRWGEGNEEFSRPVHWALMLYGNEVIEHELLGVKTSGYTKGHRFHHPQELIISSAKNYEAQLKEVYVIADFSKRRQIIKDQILQLAIPYQATVVMPEELLDEVTSIVEWPQALLGSFDNDFLEVPSEALIASMQSHQKCFALKDQEGNLLPYFITVANIESSHPQQVILGNEKVIRARLSDAAFFFRQDKKRCLSSYVPATEQVVFQIKLGSLQDKAQRIKVLMEQLGSLLDISPEMSERAAVLSKCDLLTGMVNEFPELQGLMGYYYALHDGEDVSVAHALNEQYMPRFAADILPKNNLGLALSLADRMDTLVGIFAIGQKPTGVKDPFKLRRHALAVVRLLISTPAPLNLTRLISEALVNYKERLTLEDELLYQIKSFILERLNSYYQSQAVPNDLVQAVRARQEDWLFDLDKRLAALNSFVTMPEAASLSAACKRVNNLLSNAQEVTSDINDQIIEEGAERSLYDQLNKMTELLKPSYAESNYGFILKQLASLKEPVDTFFDNVMVMVHDESVKKNRLALLARLQNLLQGVADISMLQL
jgi:glycyl-tRNA synthetase beta chain